jgi:hypothetical protein
MGQTQRGEIPPDKKVMVAQFVVLSSTLTKLDFASFFIHRVREADS